MLNHKNNYFILNHKKLKNKNTTQTYILLLKN